MKDFLIVPSIISSNLAKLGDETIQVISDGADMIHFDAMDNHYVPNLTIGPSVLKSLRNYGVKIPIDVHIMAKPVDNLILNFANSGADYITFHVEASKNISKSLNLIKELGCKAGLAFNPETSLSCLENVLDILDIILIMSVNPGFSGQSFLPITLNKIKKVRKIIDFKKKNILLAIDGGIKIDNIRQAFYSGANMFVIGSAIFSQSNYNLVIKKMRNKLKINNIN